MRDSDITVLESDVTFRAVDLDTPLVLSGGTIEHFTVPYVRLTVADRSGRTARGVGTTVLSVPWSWPRSTLSISARDAIMRDLCVRIADAVLAAPAADPIRTWYELSETAAELAAATGQQIPALAALLCLGAVDNALHDGWARAAGRPAYRMYNAAHLTDDLGALFDRSLDGHYPGDFLTPPREQLPVQHLVGAGDPLTPAPGARSLPEWIDADGIRNVKVKVLGEDPSTDADRVHAVYDSLRVPAPSLAVDPNEGYESPAVVGEFLRTLRARAPEAAGAIAYIEQPIPRDTVFTAEQDFGVPVVMDEGSTGVDSLRRLRTDGWNGVVIKAGKGQTLALLAHSYAVVHGLFVTVQDLTAVDLAFRHSARLVSLLRLSSGHLEYNSRQYAPAANAELARTHPELACVRDGTVRLGAALEPGIY